MARLLVLIRKHLCVGRVCGVRRRPFGTVSGKVMVARARRKWILLISVPFLMAKPLLLVPSTMTLGSTRSMSNVSAAVWRRPKGPTRQLHSLLKCTVIGTSRRLRVNTAWFHARHTIGLPSCQYSCPSIQSTANYATHSCVSSFEIAKKMQEIHGPSHNSHALGYFSPKSTDYVAAALQLISERTQVKIRVHQTLQTLKSSTSGEGYAQPDFLVLQATIGGSHISFFTVKLRF